MTKPAQAGNWLEGACGLEIEGELQTFPDRDARARFAREQGFRGVCEVCLKPIGEQDNFAEVHPPEDFTRVLCLLHEGCVVQWQQVRPEDSAAMEE